MNESQEGIQIVLEKQTANKRLLSAKVAVRIKSEIQDIFVYNGASQYLVQTVLKEVMSQVS